MQYKSIAKSSSESFLQIYCIALSNYLSKTHNLCISYCSVFWGFTVCLWYFTNLPSLSVNCCLASSIFLCASCISHAWLSLFSWWSICRAEYLISNVSIWLSVSFSFSSTADLLTCYLKQRHCQQASCLLWKKCFNSEAMMDITWITKYQSKYMLPFYCQFQLKQMLALYANSLYQWATQPIISSIIEILW